MGGPVIFRGGGRNFFGDVLGGLKIKIPWGRGGHIFHQEFGGGGVMCSIGFCFH